MQSHYTGIITVEPGKRGGKPCILGFTVYDILEYLASGMTEAEILADFPDLTCVSFEIKNFLVLRAMRGRFGYNWPSFCENSWYQSERTLDAKL